MCSSLDDLTDGAIAYADDSEPPFTVGTIATHSCGEGFVLSGNLERTCAQENPGDLNGIWTGLVPTCDRE